MLVEEMDDNALKRNVLNDLEYQYRYIREEADPFRYMLLIIIPILILFFILNIIKFGFDIFALFFLFAFISCSIIAKISWHKYCNIRITNSTFIFNSSGPSAFKYPEVQLKIGSIERILLVTDTKKMIIKAGSNVYTISIENAEQSRIDELIKLLEIKEVIIIR